MYGKTLVATLAATTFLTAGVVYAADQAKMPAQSPEQAAAVKDAGKLSAEGTRAYADVALTRLAIFDGRTADAKKFVEEADQDFDKAKTDDSVFLKAESELRSPNQANDAKGAEPNASKEASAQDNPSKTAEAGKSDSGDKSDMNTPKRWLPVDAEMSVNEDFTANPKKAAAVAEANKKLAKGDKQGAMESLKLADVNIDYVMAVVPLDQTLTDVHQAAQLVDSGKYYEASQELRQVQDSTRYDLLDVSGVPTSAKPAAAPATH